MACCSKWVDENVQNVNVWIDDDVQLMVNVADDLVQSEECYNVYRGNCSFLKTKLTCFALKKDKMRKRYITRRKNSKFHQRKQDSFLFGKL